jgi:peptidoglycan/xylan/chitin deacetylase (PgdA/CDA1 family)
MLKRIINLAGGIVVSIYDHVHDLGLRIIGKRPHSRCIVLAYHSVYTRQRDNFAKQMDTLLRLSKPIRADVPVLPATGGNFTAVTFDDGLENIIDNALPELKKREIPATLFIVTDALGKNPSWEYFGGDDPTKERAMTEEQLRRLPSDLVTIGSHTMSHPVLPKVGKNSLKEELTGSRAQLGKILGQDIRLFSFPYGAFDQSVVAACREAGYQRVFTALPVRAFSEQNEFVSGRVGVTPDDWDLEFRLKLTGAYRWLPMAFGLKRKILTTLRGSDSNPITAKTESKRVA